MRASESSPEASSASSRKSPEGSLSIFQRIARNLGKTAREAHESDTTHLKLEFKDGSVVALDVYATRSEWHKMMANALSRQKIININRSDGRVFPFKPQDIEAEHYLPESALNAPEPVTTVTEQPAQHLE